MVIAGLAAAVSVAGLLLWPALGSLWALGAGASTALAFTLGLHAAPVLAGQHDAGRLAGAVMAIGYAASLLGPLSLGSLLAAVGSYRPGFGVLLAASLVIVVAGARLPHPLRPRAAE
jgi:cyanate permease